MAGTSVSGTRRHDAAVHLASGAHGVGTWRRAQSDEPLHRAQIRLGFEPGVEVRQTEHAAKYRPHEHRSQGELRHRVAASPIHLFQPLSLNFLWRPFESFYGKFKVVVFG